MARLPQPGGDSGNWGNILNDYLSQAHNLNGTLKDDIVGSDQLQDNSVTSNTIAPGAVTKTTVGLSNVDNTADAAKPISTAQQTALDSKADASALSATRFVVASSDAPLKVRAMADYVCDGTADNVEIQAAIDALGANGGTIELAGATFTLAAAIRPKSGTTLTGQGRDFTRVTAPTASSANCIEIGDGVSTVYHVTLERLRLFCGITKRAIQAKKTQYLTIRECNIAQAAEGIYADDWQWLRLHDLRVYGFKDSGIHLASTFGTEGHLGASDLSVAASSLNTSASCFRLSRTTGQPMYELFFSACHFFSSSSAASTALFRLSNATQVVRGLAFAGCTFETVSGATASPVGLLCDNDSSVSFTACLWFGGGQMLYGIQAGAGRFLADNCEFLTFKPSTGTDISLSGTATIATRLISSNTPVAGAR